MNGFALDVLGKLGAHILLASKGDGGEKVRDRYLKGLSIRIINEEQNWYWGVKTTMEDLDAALFGNSGVSYNVQQVGICNTKRTLRDGNDENMSPKKR